MLEKVGKLHHNQSRKSQKYPSFKSDSPSVRYQISEFDTVYYHLILILKPTAKIVGNYRSVKTLANTSC